MDGVLIGILVVLLLGGGSICGLIAMSRASALEQDLRKLRQQLQRLENRLTAREQAEAARMEPATPELPPFLTKGGSHRRRWEGNFVGASAPLVLNVLLNHIQRRPAARACKVGARPKHGLAVSPPQVQKFITQSP